MGKCHKATEAIKRERNNLILEQLKGKEKSNWEMARNLANTKAFKNMTVDGSYHYIKRFINNMNIASQTGEKTAAADYEKSDSFKEILNGITITIPAGAAKPITEMLEIIKEKWTLLEKIAECVPRLEKKLEELKQVQEKYDDLKEKYENLKIENEESKSTIKKLGDRVLALSRSTTPRISEKHMAISSD